MKNNKIKHPLFWKKARGPNSVTVVSLKLLSGHQEIKKYCIDCGLFQGFKRKFALLKNWEYNHRIEVSEIDIVLLPHGHM